VRLPAEVTACILNRMKLLLDRLPSSLQGRRETLAQCLLAIGQVRHVHAVYLFGSHARGEARPDSDVDLCIVADGAERQLETATEFRRALWPLRPKLAFTLLPITPNRLEEKQRINDHFFQTVLKEGVAIAEED
jgi:predicted nucleotidyltransferase